MSHKKINLRAKAASRGTTVVPSDSRFTDDRLVSGKVAARPGQTQSVVYHLLYRSYDGNLVPCCGTRGSGTLNVYDASRVDLSHLEPCGSCLIAKRSAIQDRKATNTEETANE